MRPLLLFAVVSLACACAPPTPPPASPSLRKLPPPFSDEPVVLHDATFPVCRGEPYTSSRPVRIACCYPGRSIVQRAVAQQREAFRSCYEQVLRRDRDARGRILARFTIGDDGTVPHLCIEDSEIDDSFFVDCVADAFAEASFPATPDASGCPVTTVAFPLLFRPVGEV